MSELRQRRAAKQKTCADSPEGHIFRTTQVGQKCVRCALEIADAEEGRR